MSTALVTGASEGIGLEFCRILADRGYDLILVARRKDKLNEIGKSLTAAKGIKCTVISADPVSYTHLTLPTTPYV